MEEDERPIVDNATAFEFEESGDPNREITVDEFYNHAGFGLTTFLITAGAGIAVFMYGVLITFVTLLCQYLECEDELTNTELIAIKIFTILGVMCGLPLSGLLSDKVGRSKVALSGVYFVFIFWLLSAISASLIFVTIFCVGAGFSALLPSSIVYAFEFASVFQHSRVAIILFAEYILGNVFATIVFYSLTPLIGWHWVTVFLSTPLLFLFLFYHISPDTPKYYTIAGRADQAYTILLKIHKRNKVPMLRGKLKSNELTNRGECCGPCRLTFLKSTLLLCPIFFLLSFCYYSTTYGVYMSLLETGYCGSDSVLGSTSCDINTKTVLVNSLIAYLPDILGLCLAIFLAEMSGRRFSMLLMVTVAGVASLAAIYCIGVVVSMVELGIARGLSFGALVVLYLYTVERYTTNMRCLAFSYLFVFGLVGMYMAGTVTFAFRASSTVIFIVLGVCLLLLLIPIFFLEKLQNKDVDNEIDEQIALY